MYCNCVPLASSVSIALWRLLIVGVLSLSSVELAIADDLMPQLSAAQMQQDLEFLRDTWKPQDKSFNAEQTAKFDAIVSDALGRVQSLDAVSFWMLVSKAVAASGNAHTNINGDDPPLPGLPLRFWWFKDGLYVVQAERPYARLLGARVERIGRQSTEDALRAVAPFIAGSDRRVRNSSPSYLRIPALMHRVGLGPDDTHEALTLRLSNGKTLKTTLPLQSGCDASLDDDWDVLIPADSHHPTCWMHVLDKVEQRPAIYRSPVDEQTEWLDGHRVLYLRSNMIDSGDPKNAFLLQQKLFEVVTQDIVPQPPKGVIIDLRLNSGGNFGNTILFTQSLPKVLQPDSKVLVLISTSTFSAALVTAALLRESGGSSVMLIGTPMGDNDAFWAEGAHRITLPNSKLRIKPSPEFEDWGKPCPESDRCFWADVVWGPKTPISLQPDLQVEPTFAQYAAGQDPVLEAALAQVPR